MQYSSGSQDPPPQKRCRMLGTSPASLSLTPSSNSHVVIDLTGSPSAASAPLPATSTVQQNSADYEVNAVMSLQNDEALARALQAEFDSESQEPHSGLLASHTASASTPRTPSRDNDLEYARRLQAEFDNEHVELVSSGSEYGGPFSNPKYEYSNQSPAPSVSHQNAQRPSPIKLPDRDITTCDHASRANSDRASASTQSDSRLQAREVEQAVRDLTEPILKLKCPKCKKFLLRAECNILTASQSLFDYVGGGAAVACPSCNTQSVQQDRMTMIWAVLCGFDTKSKQNKPDKKKISVPKLNRVSEQGGGTGYGGFRKRSGNAFHYAEYNTSNIHSGFGQPNELASTASALYSKPQGKIDLDDAMTAQTMTTLAALLPSYEGGSEFDLDPPTKQLQSLFLCSSILERAADLLRNNSLEDVTSKKGLYTSLIRFVQALANHHSTSALAFHERVVRSAGVSLLKVALSKATLVNNDATDTTQPLTKCLRDLAAQCSVMLRSQSCEPEDLQLFQKIRDLDDFLVANITEPNKATSSAGERAWVKDLAISDVLDEIIMAQHSLVGKQPALGSIMPGRMKRIMQEIARLQASLPDNIFVRYGSSRPDIMKFLIIGPEGTPYENGIFEFDLLCDAKFPLGPPQVQFRTTGGGSVAFNPNLYNNGKVCLSLLGTWSGEPWKSNESTLLQVLVSIQAMIFCEKPWYNEPGREKMRHDDSQSRAYNRVLYHHTVQTAMIDWLERRRYGGSSHHSYYQAAAASSGTIDSGENIWDDIVKRHFASKQKDIISTVGKWVAEVEPQAAQRRKPVAHFGTPGMPGVPAGYAAPPPAYSNFAGTGMTTAFAGTGWHGQTLGGQSGASSAAVPATSSGVDLLQKLRGAVETLKSSAASSHGVGFDF